MMMMMMMMMRRRRREEEAAEEEEDHGRVLTGLMTAGLKWLNASIKMPRLTTLVDTCNSLSACVRDDVVGDSMAPAKHPQGKGWVLQSKPFLSTPTCKCRGDYSPVECDEAWM